MTTAQLLVTDVLMTSKLIESMPMLLPQFADYMRILPELVPRSSVW